MENEPKFNSNIEEWLLYTHNAATPIAPKELVAFVRARTGLSEAQCRLVISGIFAEITGVLLNMKRFATDEIGELFLSTTGRLMWRASQRFKIKINGKQEH